MKSISRIDHVSRRVFPVDFIVFNTVDLLDELHGDQVGNPVSRLTKRNISIALHPTFSMLICVHILKKPFLFRNI